MARSREIIRRAGKKAEARGRARTRKGTSMVSGGRGLGFDARRGKCLFDFISAESEAREAAVARTPTIYRCC